MGSAGKGEEGGVGAGNRTGGPENGDGYFARELFKRCFPSLGDNGPVNRQGLGRRAFVSAHVDGLVNLTRWTATLDQVQVWTAPRAAGITTSGQWWLGAFSGEAVRGYGVWFG